MLHTSNHNSIHFLNNLQKLTNYSKKNKKLLNCFTILIKDRTINYSKSKVKYLFAVIYSILYLMRLSNLKCGINYCK